MPFAPLSVFVGNLPRSVTATELEEHFASIAPVKRSFVVNDESNAEKSFGFVYFSTSKDAQAAVDAFNGKTFQSKRIIVDLAKARHSKDSDDEPEDGAVGHGRNLPSKASRIMIRNLPFECDESRLREEFAPYGEVVEVHIPRKVGGQARGFAFVEFDKVPHAAKAIRKMNGERILGRPVAVDWALAKTRYEALKSENPSLAAAEERKKEKTKAKNDNKSRRKRSREGHSSDSGSASDSDSNGDGDRGSSSSSSSQGRKEGKGGNKRKKANKSKGHESGASDKSDRAKDQRKATTSKKKGRASDDDDDDGNGNEDMSGSSSQGDHRRDSDSDSDREDHVGGDDDDDSDREDRGGGDDDDDNDSDDAESEGRSGDLRNELSRKAGRRATNTEKSMQEKKEDLATSVFVRNLLFETTQHDLENLFSRFGQVVFARVVVDKHTGRSKGTAFVKFRKVEAAEAAIAAGSHTASELEAKGFSTITARLDEGHSRHDLRKAAQGSDDPQGGQGSGSEGGAAGLVLDGRRLFVTSAVPRETSKSLTAANARKKEASSRRIDLLQEGYFTAGAPEAEGVSEKDLQLRASTHAEAKAKLKNPDTLVSDTRLSVHNIPVKITEAELKAAFLLALYPDGKPWTKAIKQVKIVRDKDRVGSDGLGKSKGFGFLEFVRADHAMRALRVMNNNPKYYSDSRRLIVQFAVENRAKIKKHEAVKKLGAVRAAQVAAAAAAAAAGTTPTTAASGGEGEGRGDASTGANATSLGSKPKSKGSMKGEASAAGGRGYSSSTTTTTTAAAAATVSAAAPTTMAKAAAASSTSLGGKNGGTSSKFGKKPDVHLFGGAGGVVEVGAVVANPGSEGGVNVAVATTSKKRKREQDLSGRLAELVTIGGHEFAPRGAAVATSKDKTKKGFLANKAEESGGETSEGQPRLKKAKTVVNSTNNAGGEDGGSSAVEPALRAGTGKNSTKKSRRAARKQKLKAAILQSDREGQPAAPSTMTKAAARVGAGSGGGGGGEPTSQTLTTPTTKTTTTTTTKGGVVSEAGQGTKSKNGKKGKKAAAAAPAGETSQEKSEAEASSVASKKKGGSKKAHRGSKYRKQLALEKAAQAAAAMGRGDVVSDYVSPTGRRDSSSRPQNRPKANKDDTGGGGGASSGGAEGAGKGKSLGSSKKGKRPASSAAASVDLEAAAEERVRKRRRDGVDVEMANVRSSKRESIDASGKGQRWYESSS